MLTFGVDTFIWTEDFLEKDLWIVEKAHSLGFKAIDFAIAHPDTFPVDRVVEELKKYPLIPITSTTLGLKTNLISDDSKIRQDGIDHMKQMVDINKKIGSKILGGVNYAGWGYLTGKPRTDREWDHSVSAMKAIVAYAEEVHSELVICIEPVNRFETHFINTAEDAVRYCKAVGGNHIKVHLDAFHMIREEMSFKEAVYTCGSRYLGYVHVCESNRGIPGTGLVPWVEFFQALEAIGYQNPCVIESFDPSFEELNANCAIWRKFADTGEELAIQGLANLTKIAEDNV
ncbi:sugar phosphate isomerase/epimerase [Erysipelothrix sp. HDW6C]|uniref:sugar phosphate isomerase/epimerase family protein n=1 Tax=Erysipelothrix sp. HDW6C TaxID=2714930 RepID=UPI00140E6B9E|nr:sugar phosphate isomerase/epimerase family protein [Erysipelothrix sp. HDW6C]QIK70664.1 sugar phosphate isomerase/epimerase [Erysipelothrix sp. HDW6C]